MQLLFTHFLFIELKLIYNIYYGLANNILVIFISFGDYFI